MTGTIRKELIGELIADAKTVWPENFSDIEVTFNACCFAMAFQALGKIGLFQHKGDFETMASIREKVGLFKDAEYVMTHILRILSDEKVLEPKDGGWVCIDNEPYVDTPAEALVKATRQFPEEGAPFQWLARSQDGLVEFIKGHLYAEEIMLPDFKLVEEVYNTSNVYGFYSRLGGKVIKRLVESHFTKPVTMFEIGAGTGNGTSNVLSQTSDHFEKYIFTDISKALVQMGQRRFKKSGYDFMNFKVYDVTKDLAEQDIEAGSVDIVLAVNVMHATDDILVGISNARKLLHEDGILVLSELSPPEGGLYRYMEMTFGLLPSYSVYRDKERRPVAPIIRPKEWVQAFDEVGFRQVAVVPGDQVPGSDRGGIVLGVK